LQIERGLQIADCRLQIGQDKRPARRSCNLRFSICNLQSAIFNLSFLALLLPGCLPTDKVPPAERQQNMARIHAGMSADEVRKLLGSPDHTARQILDRRYVEQWSYDDPPGFWIELDCVKGQDPRVIGVHKPGDGA
jgi:hypothetical protein